MEVLMKVQMRQLLEIDAVLVPVHTFTATNVAEAVSGASNVCGEIIFASEELYYQTCSHEC